MEASGLGGCHCISCEDRTPPSHQPTLMQGWDHGRIRPKAACHMVAIRMLDFKSCLFRFQGFCLAYRRPGLCSEPFNIMPSPHTCPSNLSVHPSNHNLHAIPASVDRAVGGALGAGCHNLPTRRRASFRKHGAAVVISAQKGSKYTI